MTVEFRAINADREPARSLIAATLADYEKVYGDTDLGDTPSATAAEMVRPYGAFLVAYDRDRSVGCGGLKRLDADTAEIKRMYVVADARGRGVGRSTLIALEEEARRLGYRRAVRVRRVRRDPRLQRQPVRRVLGGEAPLSSRV